MPADHQSWSVLPALHRQRSGVWSDHTASRADVGTTVSVLFLAAALTHWGLAHFINGLSPRSLAPSHSLLLWHPATFVRSALSPLAPVRSISSG